MSTYNTFLLKSVFGKAMNYYNKLFFMNHDIPSPSLVAGKYIFSKSLLSFRFLCFSLSVGG